MALQTYGILGPVTQKIGNVVGAKWKDRYYFRTLVTPSNPNTAAQQAVRTNFATLVAAGRLILSSVLQTYWDPYYTGMSGFNGFIKYNMEAQPGAFDWSLVQVARGSLEGSTISGAVYADPTVTVSYSTATSGNGLATDEVHVVVFDTANNVAFINSGGETRTDGSAAVAAGAGRDEANLEAFLFLHRGSGSTLEVSNSDHSAVTV